MTRFLMAYTAAQDDVIWEECGGSVVECLSRDQGVGDLTRANALCPWARHFILCLVLVKPKKTRPNMMEKLLTWT